ncbi:F0F1 ATP synthase subunit epsilon [Dichotomicrobium thermohalophilum]|uniref:ATP synthase epsilon chain n=1 Tax=Dichotomicrobium thermohalophilum TaxID=933063 RepID=A0A397QAB8_9HYPH|nr:F0F1 ATP synthase subunit epsilon [Dichotomicrobium thermohalophilum]RIA55074.1 F-type H+-transporting ATPase subunit epsilon [Dichotomicrobium thermohalophilum]
MPDAMHLYVFSPADSVFDGEVLELTAHGHDGLFGILPRHVDYTAPLVPGILAFVDAEENEGFIAVDGGVLLKIERKVRVATRRAVRGDDLAVLRQTVRREFLALSEHEREARNAVARLEAGIIRRFIEIEEMG